MSEKVTFSLPCLKSLLSSKTSCVYCQKGCKRSLSLLPIHLPNLKHSIREIFDSKVTFYDLELDGIILSHKNVKVHSSVELEDDGNFKLDYSADIYIFKPSIGSVLTGQVNKKCKDVIGCLVHSVFYVTIPRGKNSGKPWLGQHVTMGQTIHFKVVKLDYTSRLPFIKGELISVEENDDEGMDSGVQECVEENALKKEKKLKRKAEMPESPEKIRKRKCLEEFDVERENKKVKLNAIAEDIIFSPPAPIKNEKKKKKKSLDDSEYDEPALASSTMLIDESPVKKKKKSKKHSKDFLEDLENQLLSQAVASIDAKVDEISPIKEEKSAKKKKKHSHIETDVVPVSDETSHKKKKKKFSNTSGVKVDDSTIKDLENELLNEALTSMDQGSPKKNKNIEEIPIKKKKQKQLLMEEFEASPKEMKHKKAQFSIETDIAPVSDETSPKKKKKKKFSNTILSGVKPNESTIKDLENELLNEALTSMDQGSSKKNKNIEEIPIKNKKQKQLMEEFEASPKEKKHKNAQFNHNGFESPVKDKKHNTAQISPDKTEIPVYLESEKKIKQKKKHKDNAVSDITTELLAQAEASFSKKKKDKVNNELIEESPLPGKIKKKKKNIENTPIKNTEPDNLIDQLLAQAEASFSTSSKKKKKHNGLQIDEDSASPKIKKKKKLTLSD